MIKRIFAVILTLAVLLTACACSLFPKPAEPTPEPTAEPSAEPSAEPTEEPAETPAPTPMPTPAPEPLPEGVPEGIGEYARECVLRARDIMDELTGFVESSPIPCDSAVYPFVPADKRASLSPEEAAIYDAMLSAAVGFEDAVFDGEPEALENALAALYFDHPEIEVYFSAEVDEEDGSWYSVFFVPEARYADPFRSDDARMEELKSQLEAFEVTGRYVASRVPEELSAIDKYRLLALYISEISQYAHVHGEIPRYATTAYGAVINGYSICQGYALGFEYLCRLANLDCRRVRNEFNDENMHFWDIVTLDQGTYYVDVTWCDGSVSDCHERYWLYWFMFTAEKNHVANDGTTTTGAPLGLYP
ncbi:MAG: hypothetical protein II590_06180 [Clostridia bacterium]|nr:hypothetical protein [Clostridia bacterium]